MHDTTLTSDRMPNWGTEIESKEGKTAMKAAQEGALEGMDTRIGKTGMVRLVVVALVALSLMLVAAFAVAPKADAHQTEGSSTSIYVDGNLVKSTSDDHFTYSKILKPGCHSIRVVSRETNDEGTVQRTVQSKNTCVNERAKLTVRVSDGNVFSSVTTNY